MYNRIPFHFLVARLRKYVLSFPACQYFFPGTIPFLSDGTASNRTVLCKRDAVLNLAASTEHAIISTNVFTAVPISEPKDHGGVLCCTQCDRRAV